MDIKPTGEEIAMARQGVYMQLKETTKIAEVHGSLAQGIQDLGLTDFIENNIHVIASSNAWAREADRRLHCSTEMTGRVNGVIKAIHKAFGKYPVTCDDFINVNASDYNEIAYAVNKMNKVV